MDLAERQHAYEELLRRLVAALRSSQLYTGAHPLKQRNLGALVEAVQLIHSHQTTVVIGFVGTDVVVNDLPLAKIAETLSDLPKRLQARGIERIAIERGAGFDEIAALIDHLNASQARDARPADPGATAPDDAGLGLPHVRVGRIAGGAGDGIREPGETTLRKLYGDAVGAAELVWESARAEGQPELPAARHAVDALAEAVSQNRTTMLGLAAMKRYDNYTYTHMVNVSILTMGQAKALGLEGRLLRELGLAALMHDIGKVRTPLEILNKPDGLTEAEFEVMKRHTTDGAEILRRTPEMPVLAPIVALEHHLRADGAGYPAQVHRESLNLGTTLCGIADVYDAMRNQRSYQNAFPTDRILHVLERNDGKQFDQHLVRRFVQLLGVFPPGNLVRLTNGEVGVVVLPNAKDPYRPRVNVVIGADGARLAAPLRRDLWDVQADSGALASIAAPVDPDDYHIDALAYLQ